VATIQDNLIIARPCFPGSGCTWSYTLASRAGHIIGLIEERYGQRDRAFTLLGIEFVESGPQIWFPGNCRHVVIQLNTAVMNDEIRALYQLSHECVHLLDPPERGLASVFEEGVATMFSAEYAQSLCPTYRPAEAKYDAAASLAREALRISPNAIRNLRGNGTRFSSFSKEQLELTCPGLSPQICTSLCTKFQSWNGQLTD
jgi:hypothetical protein